jgi:hypothetical protein
MLPGADGRPMICAAVAGIRCSLDDLIITVLREHDERFGAVSGLAAAFGGPVRVSVLEQPTRSQSETVAKTLQMLQLDEPFLVKDSDGAFDLDQIDADVGYVCVDSLANHDRMNAANKSYVRITDDGRITTIREKEVISDSFNVGGYFFPSPSQFLCYYDRLSSNAKAGSRELYLSAVISVMLQDGIEFRVRRIGNYRDWGTLEDWCSEIGSARMSLPASEGFRFDRPNELLRPPSP